MPTYEYECGSCGHKFEQLQSIMAAPLTKCPACGRKALRRLIGSGGGVIFKGSGFYQTDYRSESYKKGAEAENKPAKADAGAAPAPGTAEKTTPPAEGQAKPAKSPEAKPAQAKPTSEAKRKNAPPS